MTAVFNVVAPAPRTIMLPRPVFDDIFNLKYPVSDTAIDHIADELHQFGCVVNATFNFDAAVIIHFSRVGDESHPPLEGELRIDRIEKRFDISAVYGDETVLPAFGDWALVQEYLSKLLGCQRT